MNSQADPQAYHYDLPEDLIARRPASPRDHSRLLVYREATDEIVHTYFKHISEFLTADTSLVFNQTKVFPCRLFVQRTTGGKAEIFVLTLTPDKNQLYRCLVRSTGKKKVGHIYIVDENTQAEICGQGDEGQFLLKFSRPIEDILKSSGVIPIPPYIRGGVSDQRDLEDYQTIFAKELGSVAAPTAGLHFTDDVFSSLEKKGIKRNYVTLHIGPGTFAPVRPEQIAEKKLHREYFQIESKQWEEIKSATRKIAVGTTSLRALESYQGERGLSSTEIFIYPGCEVPTVEGLLTNFHLPGSSLMMLVAALIGREKLLELYDLAVKEQYRFYSYGDAMLILRDPNKMTGI